MTRVRAHSPCEDVNGGNQNPAGFRPGFVHPCFRLLPHGIKRTANLPENEYRAGQHIRASMHNDVLLNPLIVLPVAEQAGRFETKFKNPKLVWR
jgi:hypothetical protein